MTRLVELTRLNRALDLMGLDIGSNPNPDAVIPPAWDIVCHLADEELKDLNENELIMLCQGCEDEMDAIGQKAPRTREILNAAFDDGELADTLFKPWANIFEARAATQRVSGKK